MRANCVMAVALLVAGLSGAASLEAAAEPMLTNVQGKVLVDKGAGFTRVSNGVALRPGDQILVSDNASADLFFDVDCQIELQPGAQLTITDISPCTAGAPGKRYWLWGGAVALGAGAAILSLSGGGDHDNNPASP